MKFSLRTMLLAVAFAAITMAAYCAGWRLFYETNELPQLWFAATAFAMADGMIEGLWLWMPLLFVAFAAGRQRLAITMLVAFAACEAGAIALLPLWQRLVEFIYSDAVPPVATP